MKDLLKKAVEACVNEDLEAAKDFYKQYFHLKSKSILEALDKGVMKGHCDDCGEETTTSKKIVDSKAWVCGKCGGKHFAVENTPEGKADKKSEKTETA